MSTVLPGSDRASVHGFIKAMTWSENSTAKGLDRARQNLTSPNSLNFHKTSYPLLFAPSSVYLIFTYI